MLAKRTAILPRKIDYYVSLHSPWTFFGHQKLAEIAQKHGATIDIHPVDFGRIFSATGGVPLAKRSAQRQAYRMMELERWRTCLGIPVNLNPEFFPAMERQAALVATSAKMKGHDIFDFCGRVLKAVWIEEKDIADAAVIIDLANQAGLAGTDLIEAAANPKVLAAYIANSEQAIKRGVFGAPSYIIEDEIFWGQDRLDFVDEKLQKTG